MTKTKKKLVPTKKVEMEETKEAEMGIEPKIEPKEEKKLADKKVKEEKAKEDAKKKMGTEIYAVINNRKQFIREYTPEIHGDKRKALAEEFAKKIKGKVVIK